MKMTEAKSVGISKTMFMVGLIVAILASSLISAAIVTQLPLAEGPKGDKGDRGDTGAIGATGPQGPRGATGAAGATYVVNTDGSIYWSTRYDGKVVYNGTDARTVIQSTINVMDQLQSIVILGDITIDGSIDILKVISYFHYGKAKIEGNFSYLRIGDQANLVDKWLFVHVTSIEGPGKTVGGHGIHLINCAQNTFVIGRISDCWAGIFFSKEGGALATKSDNKFYFNNIEECNKAIFFEGAPSLDESPFMEGNEFHGNIFANDRGIEIEANTKSGFGIFMGVIDNLPIVGSKDFYNLGVQNGGWLILAKYIRISESSLGPNDIIISPSI
jgi:hypothetical protein